VEGTRNASPEETTGVAEKKIGEFRIGKEAGRVREQGRTRTGFQRRKPKGKIQRTWLSDKNRPVGLIPPNNLRVRPRKTVQARPNDS